MSAAVRACRIYIPLWFYSNMTSILEHSFNFKFTFHYGSILIPFRRLHALKILWFTFHYGSILIYCVSSYPFGVNLFTFHYGSILIYSSLIGIKKDYTFTFHYGSILIFSFELVRLLHSAFTFHYGSILIKYSICWYWFLQIYIPLWFYSNVLCDIVILSNKKFTFHYGSILIGAYLKEANAVADLHSTMVLF